MIKKNLIMENTSKINVDEISQDFLVDYDPEFVKFVKENDIKLPQLSTGNGKALSAMSHNPGKFWTRDDCESFVKQYDISTRDSIQLFNKHEQRGFKCIPDKGKNMLIYPYELSSKKAMRKDFKYDGSEEQKNQEIENIKSTIKHDYIDVPNSEWQLGHKNPDSTDSSSENLVLQPPIQGKYRDNYIFIDTLTKQPTPKKILADIKSGKSPFTDEQIKELRDGLNALSTP